VKAKLKAGNYNPKFGLYDAYMVHAVDSLKAGSKGLSCIQGNYFPELIVWLCQNYNNEALAEQVSLVQQFFINQMDVMHNVYPIVAKYFLQQRGFDMNLYTRRDVGSFTPAIKTQVEQLYTDYEALSSQISLEQVI
jgi:4-hydroxy-tetrahydrodipicolinate synthase